MTASLSLEGLSYETGGRLLVDRADLTAVPGETVGLVGPNGSGKTTLLRCVYGTLRPSHGHALLDGRDLHTMTPKERARRIATVPQDGGTEFELTVREVVAMGRSPHKRFWEADTAADTTLADEALARVGIMRPRAARLPHPVRRRTPARPRRPRPGPAAGAARPGRADQPPRHQLPARHPHPDQKGGDHQPPRPARSQPRRPLLRPDLRPPGLLDRRVRHSARRPHPRTPRHGLRSESRGQRASGDRQTPGGLPAAVHLTNTFRPSRETAYPDAKRESIR